MLTFLLVPWFLRNMHPLLHLLRAARFLLGLKQGLVDDECKFTQRTVFKIEAGKHTRLPRTAFSLKHYYEAKGVEFVDAADGHGAGIRWKTVGPVDPVRSHLFRAGRGLADLSQERVALQAGIDETFVNRLEKDTLKHINEESLQRYELFLRAKNVEITPASTNFGAGVRWIVHIEEGTLRKSNFDQ
jgi:hypothetical protein